MAKNTLHPRARTTPATRAEIKELYFKKGVKTSEISKRFGVSQTTIYKWIKRESNQDLKMGTKTPNTVLSKFEEQVICSVRKNLLLSLDDLYITLKDQIPSLSRSNLHRCLQRHGLSNLKDMEEYKNRETNRVLEKEQEQILKDRKKNNPHGNKFEDYEIGFVHIDITTIFLTKEEKYYLYVAIDRVSKYVHYKVYDQQTRETAIDFLKEVYNMFPFKIHTILTDNGIQFTNTTFKGFKEIKEQIKELEEEIRLEKEEEIRLEKEEEKKEEKEMQKNKKITNVVNKETNQNINNGTINEIIDNETNKEKMNNNKLQTLIELKKLYKDKLKSEFTLECQKLGIEHRTTKPKHPWTNGQVEVFNRFIKDNTVNKYKYISKEQLVTHLDNLLIAYNFAKRLVSLKYITPYQKMLYKFKHIWENYIEK